MRFALAFAAGLMLAQPAYAQTTEHDHTGPATASPADKALKDAMSKMHATMDVPLTGDPDADFVAMMIPHHQGAIEMAEVELQYGKDPQIRRLAHAIVAAQREELAQMRRWQARRGQKHAQ